MSERIHPPIPLPPLTPQQVKESFDRLKAESYEIDRPVMEENEVLASSLVSLRRSTTEWDDLYGSSIPEDYGSGIRAGIALAQHYESPGLTLESASSFAFNEAVQRSWENIPYPSNTTFHNFLEQRLKLYFWRTDDLINRANSLYPNIIGRFQDREPHVAEYLFTAPRKGYNQIHNLLRNLGIMDVLDTYRAKTLQGT